MKKTGLFLCLLSLSTIFFGQTVQWGDWGFPSKIPNWKGDVEERFYQKADGGFYAVRFQYDIKVFQTRIEADEYDAGFERVRTIDLTPPYNYVGFPSFVDFHPIGEKYYMFLDNFVKEKEKAFLYVQEVDMNSGKLLGEPREIAGMMAPSAIRAGEFEIAFSPDGQKMLVTQNESAMKKARERISFRIFDKAFNELSFNTYRLPFDAKIGVRNAPMITDEGRVYFFKEGKPDKGPRYLSMFASSENGLTLNQNTPELGMNAISDYKGMLNHLQRPVLIGYYQPASRVRLIASSEIDPHGVFIVKYDVDGNTMDLSLQDFSQHTATPSLPNCHLKEVITHAGGFIIAGEWEQNPTLSYDGTPLGSKIPTYDSRQIYLTFLDKSGRFERMVEIDKQNKTVNDGGIFNSFFILPFKAGAHVFFNDLAHKHSAQKPKLINRPVPIMYTYSNEGVLVESVILDEMGVGGPEDDFRLCTDEVRSIGENTYLVKGASRAERKFGKLRINW